MSERARGVRSVALSLLLVVAGGCAGKSRNLVTHAAPELTSVAHRRIAVLPFARGPKADAPEDAPEILTGQIYSALVATGRFSVTTPAAAADAARSLDAKRTPADAARVGTALGADAVVLGAVMQYVDRVGSDYGIESPAAVDFAIGVVESQSGQEVWRGEFAEEQQPLLVDLSGAADFMNRRGRWLTAAELSEQGARQVVEALEVAWFGGKTGAASSMPNAAATPACTTCPR